MKVHTALLEGNDHHLRNQITNTPCIYEDFHCIPEEEPLTQIIWDISNHKFTIYRDIGLDPAKRIRDYILIPLLGIAGAVTEEEGNAALLETGYQIIKTQNGTWHTPPKFENISREYVTQTVSNVQREISDAHITINFMHQHEITTQLASLICETNKELVRIQKWILSSFPDTSSEYIFPKPGRMVSQVGDGILIHKCEPIWKFTIHWNISYQGKCYTKFPVTSPYMDQIRFLELSRRRIVRTGQHLATEQTTKDGT